MSSKLPIGNWSIDTSATLVTVTVKKLGVITVRATLDVVSGSIEIDNDHEVSSVEIVADATSYASPNAKRNQHVVSDDFLDAETYPTISMKASSATASGETYLCSGTVTVKGQSAPIGFTITDLAIQGSTATFNATASVDRQDIGISKMPSLIIGSTLGIEVSAVATTAE